MRPRRIILLGSTGSIGTQTIDVVAGLNRAAAQGHAESAGRFEIVGLAAGSNADAVLAQATGLGVRDVAIAHPKGGRVDAPPGVRVRTGVDAAERLVREVEADIVLGAMVGAAGLPATLAALELGRDVALANKETLVAAGEVVVPAARRSGAKLLPVDSEHSALWQCLPEACPPCAVGPSVKRMILTASGGPFRTKAAREIYDATPEQALAHPTWSMGAKVTIDCASLTNKGLEVIEAHWLFGVERERLEVLVHPQSIVHGFVEFADGSTVAQLGAPDMRTPIQCALAWPKRPPGRAAGINWSALGRLDFEPPDLERFPALALAFRVIEMGGAAGAVMNAANERAVQAFLDRRIPFGRITELTLEAVEEILGSGAQPPLRTLDEALRADGAARRFVADRLSDSRAAAPSGR